MIGKIVFGAVALGILAMAGTAAAASSSGSTPPNRDPEPDFVWGKWTADDFRALAAIATSLQMNPEDLLTVLASESGLDPSAKNPAGSLHPIAVGLNQLTSVANSSVGLTEAQRVTVPTWPVSAQLPLVHKFFASLAWTRAGRPYPTAGVIYAANFAPARMGDGSEDTVLYRQEEGDAYSLNKALDRDGKGSITIGDMTAQVNRVRTRPFYQAARAALAQATGV